MVTSLLLTAEDFSRAWIKHANFWSTENLMSVQVINRNCLSNIFSVYLLPFCLNRLFALVCQVLLCLQSKITINERVLHFSIGW